MYSLTFRVRVLLP